MFPRFRGDNNDLIGLLVLFARFCLNVIDYRQNHNDPSLLIYIRNRHVLSSHYAKTRLVANTSRVYETCGWTIDIARQHRVSFWTPVSTGDVLTSLSTARSVYNP